MNKMIKTILEIGRIQKISKLKELGNILEEDFKKHDKQIQKATAKQIIKEFEAKGKYTISTQGSELTIKLKDLNEIIERFCE